MATIFERINNIGGRLISLGVFLLIGPLIISLPVVLAINFVLTLPVWAAVIATVAVLLNSADLIRFFRQRNFFGLFLRPLMTILIVMPLIGLVWITFDPVPVDGFDDLTWNTWRVLMLLCAVVGGIVIVFRDSKATKVIADFGKGLRATGIVPRF